MSTPISPEQLASHLLDTRTISIRDVEKRKALARGSYQQLHASFVMRRDVYLRLALHQQRLAHALAVGRSTHKSVLIGRSAARLHNIWTVALTPEPVEIANPNGHIPSRRDRQMGVKYHGFMLVPTDIVSRAGCRATTAARTCVDIARLHGFREGLIACDWALAHGLTRGQLREAARALGRVRGAGSIRRAIDYSSARSESPFESLLRAMLIDEQLPNIQLQMAIGPFRVDLLVGGVLVVEIDGDVKYANDADLARVTREELKREKYLRNQGYWVLRFAPRELLKTPGDVLQTIRETLAEHARIGSPKPRIVARSVQRHRLAG